MKKNIAILGSTGSIGKTTVQIISNEKKSFNVILLTTNKNYSEILKQISKLKPKNLVINNFYYFNKIKKKFKKSKLKIFNNLDDFLKNNKLKIDYTMCAISGIEGLNPILNIIMVWMIQTLNFNDNGQLVSSNKSIIGDVISKKY